jgi:hypothetical protein
MTKYRISPAMRFFFLVSGAIIWGGIWFTGVTVVHWLLYIPAVFFAFAALSGVCPGIIISKWLFRER